MAGRGPIRTYLIRTFGCQMNVHDSERIAGELRRAGLTQVTRAKEADLIIINSCSVRAKPEHKALSEAGRYQDVRKRRGTRVVLAGCVAQQEGERLIQRAPYLDAVMGPDAIVRMPDILGRLERGLAPVIAVEEHDLSKPCFVPLGPSPDAPISVPVTIMKGCNNYCTYCVVPYVRGREVSRPLADILDEVAELGRRGCREVVLLGQNVNSYRDPDGAGFPQLLAALDRQAGVDRIRFTTSHPKDASAELVTALAALPRVCEHVHLALQSGSDRILDLMARRYTRSEFIERASAFRRAVPGVSITTDLIVGFPSEREEDFEHTLEVVREVAFDQAFSFKYSARPGTRAAGMPDDVTPEVKQGRLERLQALLEELSQTSLARLCGKRLEVLAEGTSLRDPSASTGRTRCNRVVNFGSGTEPPAPGRLVEVEIIEARGHTLWGHLLTSNQASNKENQPTGLTNGPSHSGMGEEV